MPAKAIKIIPKKLIKTIKHPLNIDFLILRIFIIKVNNKDNNK